MTQDVNQIMKDGAAMKENKVQGIPKKVTKCDFCHDPVCLDDFITGECPAEENIEDCGCVTIRDSETGDILETIEYCQNDRPIPNSPQYEDEAVDITPFLTEIMPITETLHVVRYWYWLDGYYHCRYKLDHAGRPAKEVPAWDSVVVIWPVMA